MQAVGVSRSGNMNLMDLERRREQIRGAGASLRQTRASYNDWVEVSDWAAISDQETLTSMSEARISSLPRMTDQSATDLGSTPAVSAARLQLMQ
jgi:hypothetical protein